MTVPRFLVVEESLGDLAYIKDWLEGRGATVFVTSSTLKGLEIARTGSVDAVICGEKIQIGTVLSFPQWIFSETGFVPPYFIISEQLSHEELFSSQSTSMVKGLFASFEEAKPIFEKIF